MLPTDRQRRILDMLADRGTVRVAELSQLFSVSEMTVHRDLDRLAGRGQLRKVHGGAVLPSTHDAPPGDRACCTCHSLHASRIPMVLYRADGAHRHACCPHCGLLALDEPESAAVSALATDFIYGRRINARTASYLLAPQIHLCCTPTVLAFERAEEARRFQQGFGGQLLDLEGAKRYLSRAMRLDEE